MNNYKLTSMSLDEAKKSANSALPNWPINLKKGRRIVNLVQKVHSQIEDLVSLRFETGEWIVMKHFSGAIFPVIIPEGQLDLESWEGISMSASCLVVEDLLEIDPNLQTICDSIRRAIEIENLELNPQVISN
ncbi:hypothetical protein [Thalassotalea marina]|uniref:Uncharacterized protein n=1 Tax=Thalassotalea marina TaxID=1673741 RepID=A0A919BSK6_9GAMM|nr:hypothetical protein [Thalassotalea marina]GHG07753.1 hypothetical protein GCM10017161_41830 [Thalassotalea marina]